MPCYVKIGIVMSCYWINFIERHNFITKCKNTKIMPRDMSGNEKLVNSDMLTAREPP